MERQILAVAHRGYSAKYPENSSISYTRAIAAQSDLIESDVRLSKDCIPIAIHDADLHCLSDSYGIIAEMSGADIQNSVRKDGEKILTTEQVLVLARNHINVLLDIKTTDLIIVQKTYDIVVKTGMCNHVHFGLRDLKQVSFLRSISRQIKILGMPEALSNIKEFSMYQIDAIRIWEEWYREINFSDSSIKLWMTAGKPNKEEVGGITKIRLKQFIGKNISAVILNDPSLITGLLDDHELTIHRDR